MHQIFTFLAISQLTTGIHWPCYCTVHVMLSLSCVRSSWVEANMCMQVFIYCVLIYIYIGLRGRVGMPLSGLNPSCYCSCRKPGSGFTTSYLVVFFMLRKLKWDVIGRFVDIGGIVDLHCLIFLFIIENVLYCAIFGTNIQQDFRQQGNSSVRGNISVTNAEHISTFISRRHFLFPGRF